MIHTNIPTYTQTYLFNLFLHKCQSVFTNYCTKIQDDGNITYQKKQLFKNNENKNKNKTKNTKQTNKQTKQNKTKT